MIAPAYSITATERVLPKLALDFTTAILDSKITFTRTGSTATVTNSSGVIVGINANLPRFDYNPITFACNGLLIEESRTNVLLNSLIDGTNLTTQLVTVTASARTLSFYGTGQIVLSGTHSATVVGTGAYPSRTTYTFTPSAGALTLTVTGSIQYAQLEIGAFVTSFIPTGVAAVTRNPDETTMSGTNFSDWYNASEGTLVSTASSFSTFIPAMIDDGTNVNSIGTRSRGVGVVATAASIANGPEQLTGTTFTFSASNTVALGYKLNNCAWSLNATIVATDSVVTIPTVNRMHFGHLNGTYFSGTLKKVNFYSQRLTNAEIQAISK